MVEAEPKEKPDVEPVVEVDAESETPDVWARAQKWMGNGDADDFTVTRVNDNGVVVDCWGERGVLPCSPSCSGSPGRHTAHKELLERRLLPKGIGLSTLRESGTLRAAMLFLSCLKTPPKHLPDALDASDANPSPLLQCIREALAQPAQCHMLYAAPIVLHIQSTKHELQLVRTEAEACSPGLVKSWPSGVWVAFACMHNHLEPDK